jgi:MoxR-like ATPase
MYQQYDRKTISEEPVQRKTEPVFTVTTSMIRPIDVCKFIDELEKADPQTLKELLDVMNNGKIVDAEKIQKDRFSLRDGK